jgi:hypothetical protein
MAKWTLPILCLGRDSERDRFQVDISLVTDAILMDSVVSVAISLVTDAILMIQCFQMLFP